MQMKIAKEKIKINVLLTSSRSPISLGRIVSLKENSDYDFYVVGTNADNSFKLPMLDEQIQVPFGNDPGFIPALKKIVVEKKIQSIVPASDYETIAIARHKEEFEDLGAGCVCSKAKVTEIAIDKAKMLHFLKNKGIAVPEFETPQNIWELKEAARRLNYPQKTLVFKPAFAGGGNGGVWFVKENFGSDLLNARSIGFVTLDELSRQLQKLSEFPRVVLMQYLPGEEYSTDALSQNGEVVYVLPRVRISPLPGYSQEGAIKPNEEVRRYVTEIAEAFEFDSIFNVQLKYSEDGEPLVYEINPRVSATAVANATAGIDIVLFAILKSIKLDYPKKLRFSPKRMVRFWKEYYSDYGGVV